MKSYRKSFLCFWIIVIVLCAAILPINTQAASKVKLSKTKVTLEKNKTITLKITGTNKKVTWKTSNKKIATVSGKGKVIAKNVGNATITATVNKKKYTCKVTVKEPEKDKNTDKEESNKVTKDADGYWQSTKNGKVVWSGTNSEKSGTIGKFSWKVGTGIRVNGYTIYSMPWADDYEGEIEDIGYDVDNAIKRYNIPSASSMSGKDARIWIIDNYDLINSHKDEYGFCIAVHAISSNAASNKISKDELIEIGWESKYGELLDTIGSNFKYGTTHNKY